MKTTIKKQIRQSNNATQLLEALERANRAYKTNKIRTADFNRHFDDAMERLHQITRPQGNE